MSNISGHTIEILYTFSMITITDVREKIPLDVFDYQQLISCLTGYAKPRDRITTMLATGNLIRIRKGLYVFGDKYRRNPVNRVMLSNLIYGPSYVSLDYALSFYGLIPERVEDVTAVTTGQAKHFITPFGVFSYKSLSPNRYVTGVSMKEEDGMGFLIATAEKAIIDKVWTDKRFHPKRPEDFEEFLFDDLRVDEKGFSNLNSEQFRRITETFHSSKIEMLAQFTAGRLAGSA
ncbi:MAG: hypothetical protein HQM09_22600 [Candidatus Riflebacteria bacterium]|nr:hypothetical protein [Candidatus Riflebacteria bacterium]